jgi:hypothetical protein
MLILLVSALASAATPAFAFDGTDVSTEPSVTSINSMFPGGLLEALGEETATEVEDLMQVRTPDGLKAMSSS